MGVRTTKAVSAFCLDINCWRTLSVEQSARWKFQKSASVKSHSARLVSLPRSSATCRRSSWCSNGQVELASSRLDTELTTLDRLQGLRTSTKR